MEKNKMQFLSNVTYAASFEHSPCLSEGSKLTRSRVRVHEEGVI